MVTSWAPALSLVQSVIAQPSPDRVTASHPDLQAAGGGSGYMPRRARRCFRVNPSSRLPEGPIRRRGS